MNQREFARRRRQLMQAMGRDAIAIVPSAPEKIRNRDVEFPFRQDSDFYYLTGFPEPESVAVLVPGRREAQYILFCRERDPEKETWHGRRAGQEGACETYGADDAFPIEDIDDILPGLMEQCDKVYYAMGQYPAFDQQVIGWVNRLRAQSKTGVHTPQEFVALDHLLHDMRSYKSRAEISAMRRAARIGADAHIRAMRACRPGMREFEVEAELLHEFRRHGTTPSYNPIVGGGGNACILHYTENDAELNAGELLLIDAGCEYDYYASDITRTFPVSGKFSAAQKAVYQVVLDAQLAAIDAVRPG
ncbi:MAG: aminopeptidase P N-terminal domain-containing protein, partial [Gammaproteobacteria bacterium]